MLRRGAAALLVVPLLAVGLSACIPVPPVTRTITYSVTTDGPVISNLYEFATTATRILDSPRGWRAAGIQFVQVEHGGDFTLVLANPRHVENYDPVCDYLWSCSVGRWVVINDIRFAIGSESWPGELDWYRSMVINHEVGHFLGLGHASCSGPGQLAPVMQQQSISMQGCQINPWPLQWELDRVR
jgi:hypothetical protein